MRYINLNKTRAKENFRTRYILLIAMLFGFSAESDAQQPVLNPIPESITKSGLAIELEDFVQIPASDNSSSAKARINMLRTAQDGSERLFVNDLRGKLYVIQGNEPTVYLDLEQKLPNFKDSPGLGSGFTSFAFHPEFESNGKFYTAHSEEPGSGLADFAGPAQPHSDLQGVIMEWTTSKPTDNIFVGTKRELLRIDIYNTIHGLQDIQFNPNAKPGEPDYGNLYICQGDGGGVDRGLPENSHRLDSILGTILRIDPLGSNSKNGKYGIPEDNPFANDNDENTLGEIWAFGFRNPHRISWDTGGDNIMLIGEIGQHHIEEVNIGYAGADYGWNIREGTFLINPNGDDLRQIFTLPANDSTFGYTYPVAQYDHDEGDAIVGGYVYRGTNVPDLFGMYVFGDIKRGRLFYVPVDSLQLGNLAKINELTIFYNGAERTLPDLVDHSRADLRFGIDDDNELYVLSKVDGMIRKIVRRDVHKYPLIYSENFESESANWSPNIPENWRNGSDENGSFYELLQPGPFGTPRRPTSSSILVPYDVGNFELEVVAKSNRDTTVLARDICLFFGVQDSLQFYYSHFAGRSADVHNIIGIVNDADREKINIEPPGATNARLTDYQYHTLKIVRSVESGSIEAFFDGEKIMTALDTTFLSGKIGIGSFDDTATFKSVKLWGELVTSVEETSSLPKPFLLKQNYPNPFNPSTKIIYELDAPAFVQLRIFNTLGREVSTLVNEFKVPGEHLVKWNAKSFSSGIYYYSIEVNGEIKAVKRTIFLK